MKAKILFVYRVDQSDKANHGVLLKLEGQIKALRDLGVHTDAITHSVKDLLFNDSKIDSWSGMTPKTWMKWRFYNKLIHQDLLSYDIYILRYGLATTSLINFLDNIRSAQSKKRVFIDMPTYPFNYEWQGLYGLLALTVDRANRRKIKTRVDGILHSGAEAEIFGIPTIPFSNGVNCASIPLRTPVSTDKFEMLAIGKWQYWHGLDRILEGMNNYVKSGGRDVRLNIVGNGPALKKLKKLSVEYLLEDYIAFKGVCIGQSLDVLVNQADIGIGTLGLHRKMVALDSSLKHRDYVARGLPFVFAGNDADQLEKEPFTFVVPGDNSPVNIEKLVHFAKQLQMNNIKDQMRSFANTNLSWKAKMISLLSDLDRTE